MTQSGNSVHPTPATEDMVRELWDRQQISDVMLRFGRGLDCTTGSCTRPR